nr:alkaline phosphatase D family protein [Motilibacter aurantiacus]
MLVLLGDQVYADEPDAQMVERLQQRPGVDPEVQAEINSFDEYTWLYEKTWSHPSLRWLLSTVPSAMILDDHDLRDDWNTSAAWREHMSAQPWWKERVVGAFGSYWVYQHLGNLSPDELEASPVLREICAAATEDERDRVLDEMAWRSDQQPDAHRWSHVRQLGRTRLVMIDSRCSRSLRPGARGMVDDNEWQWLEQHLTGDVDHLLVGTSLPWLLTPSVHELEGWNEATAGGAWGTAFGKLAERIRWAVDLEHWAAFRKSFDSLTEALAEVASGRRGAPPASVLVLSGDVHLSYASRAHIAAASDDAAPVWQLVMSPFRNPLSRSIRAANRVLMTPPARAAVTWLARRAGVPAARIRWGLDHGPWFDNGVSTLTVRGRDVRLRTDLAELTAGRQQVLRTVLDESLVDARR